MKNMRRITAEILGRYREYMYGEEKAKQTIEKYMRDLQKLVEYVGDRNLTKELMISYKKYLLNEKQYKVTSINSFLVAANRFFEYMEWYEIRVKTLKVQTEIFCLEERELSKEEYKKLVETAKKEKKYRLAMILQTICATGIRISELSALTVVGVRKGVMEVNNKGKIRKVLIPEQLRKQLLIYIAETEIKWGVIFCTKSGKPINRRNVWRDMKALCKSAGVKESKVFPHNLRHLFAKSFYSIKKDISKLADILGHSNIETTRIYLRTNSREYRKQLDKMELVLEI